MKEAPLIEKLRRPTRAEVVVLARLLNLVL